MVERTPVRELRASVSGEVLLESLTHNVGLPLAHQCRQVLQLVLGHLRHAHIQRRRVGARRGQ